MMKSLLLLFFRKEDLAFLQHTHRGRASTLSCQNINTQKYLRSAMRIADIALDETQEMLNVAVSRSAKEVSERPSFNGRNDAAETRCFLMSPA
jgi:hypothetical protein